LFQLYSAPIPGNWQDFLQVDLNKIELFSFLSKALIKLYRPENKQLVVTNEDQILCVPQQEDIHLIAPCSHEEADSRMMLHVAHAVQHGHHQILVHSVDTDAVVLAVMVSATLPDKNEIWIAFGTGKSSNIWQPIK